MLFLWLANLPAVGQPYEPLWQGYFFMGEHSCGEEPEVRYHAFNSLGSQHLSHISLVSSQSPLEPPVLIFPTLALILGGAAASAIVL